MKLMCAYIFDS